MFPDSQRTLFVAFFVCVCFVEECSCCPVSDWHVSVTVEPGRYEPTVFPNHRSLFTENKHYVVGGTLEKLVWVLLLRARPSHHESLIRSAILPRPSNFRVFVRSPLYG